MPLAQALELTGRSTRTGARWRAHGIDDAACLKLLQVHAYGLIPGPHWQAWHVLPDGRLALWMPTRAHPPLSRGELEHVALAYGLARALRDELAQVRVDVGRLRAMTAGLEPANEGDGALPRQFALL